MVARRCAQGASRRSSRQPTRRSTCALVRATLLTPTPRRVIRLKGRCCAVHAAWCGNGVARQLRAFRAGFVDIVPCGIESAFASFTPEESLDIVCGAAVSWDEATLRACVVPAPAPPTYESDEDHFEWLIAELLGAHFSTATNACQYLRRIRLVAYRDGGAGALSLPELRHGAPSIARGRSAQPASAPRGRRRGDGRGRRLSASAGEHGAWRPRHNEAERTHHRRCIERRGERPASDAESAHERG